LRRWWKQPGAGIFRRYLDEENKALFRAPKLAEIVTAL